MTSRYFPALVSVVQAFFAAFSLCVLGGISPADILSVILFGAAFLLFLFTQKLLHSRTLPKHFHAVCRTLAVLYTLFYTAGAYEKMAGSFDSTLFRLGFFTGSLIGLFALFLACCRLGFFLFEKLSLAQNARPLSRRQKLLCFFALLFCWLFWFLYNYPGVMTPDSISQFLQATGQKPFSSHHPVAHTLLFSLFYHIGFGLTGSVNAGIACYTVFQMLTLAATETCCLSVLASSGSKRWVLAAAFLFWGLIPSQRHLCGHHVEGRAFFGIRPALCADGLPDAQKKYFCVLFRRPETPSGMLSFRLGGLHDTFQRLVYFPVHPAFSAHCLPKTAKAHAAPRSFPSSFWLFWQRDLYRTLLA
ncbi:MAG: hypothetical protein ACLTF6_16775 [Clostridium sp.]